MSDQVSLLLDCLPPGVSFGDARKRDRVCGLGGVAAPAWVELQKVTSDVRPSLTLGMAVNRQVFLSATLANATEFAAWVASLHRQPCHVVYTDYRPTPLQHYAFPIGGNGLYAVGWLT